MTVDRATLDDVPALSGLLNVLFAREAEFVPNAERQARGLRLLLSTPDAGAVWVARDGAILAGMVSVQVVISTALSGRVAVLEDKVGPVAREQTARRACSRAPSRTRAGRAASGSRC